MIRTVLFAAVLAGTASTAFAEVGTVPSPSNPTPAYPIATDGSPLPPSYSVGSQFAPTNRAGMLSSYNGEYAAPARVR